MSNSSLSIHFIMSNNIEEKQVSELFVHSTVLVILFSSKSYISHIFFMTNVYFKSFLLILNNKDY